MLRWSYLLMSIDTEIRVAKPTSLGWQEVALANLGLNAYYDMVRLSLLTTPGQAR